MPICMYHEEFELNKKLKLRIGVFNNSDAKNSQSTRCWIQIKNNSWQNIGDSIQNALLSFCAAGYICCRENVI